MSNPAEGYESYMVPVLFRPWAERLVQAASPRADERVLDVGCGTGIVARVVAERLGGSAEIAGVDLSPDMLAVARATAARGGAAIEWHRSPAERLPFADGGFDLVLCQFALMFFADRAAALAEMRRVLTTRGRVLASAWLDLDRHPFYGTLHEVIRERLGVSALAQIFSLGDADELRSLAAGAGFGSIEIESVSMTARFPNPDGFLAGEIEVDTAAIPELQHLDAEARGAIVTAIAAEMRAPLAEATHGDRVVLPFHAHLVSARP